MTLAGEVAHVEVIRGFLAIASTIFAQGSRSLALLLRSSGSRSDGLLKEHATHCLGSSRQNAVLRARVLIP